MDCLQVSTQDVKRCTHQFTTDQVGTEDRKTFGSQAECLLCCALTLNVQSREGLAHGRGGKKSVRSV